MSEVLLPGIWYGEVSQLSLDELKNSLLSVQDERECILLIVEIMKKGDFSVKNLLIDLMNQTEDEAVLNLCIRLFCSVCTNDDLKDVNNFRFLDNSTTWPSTAPTAPIPSWTSTCATPPRLKKRPSATQPRPASIPHGYTASSARKAVLRWARSPASAHRA